MQEKQLQSKTAMLLVSMMFGMFGLHRYSMGYKNWYVQLILTFVCGIGLIWAWIDTIRIAVDAMPMADGRELKS
jgi:TM2 domain-containing membrane protein YozV